MPRTLEQVLAGFASLKAEDFDGQTPGFNGNERLDELTEDLMELSQPERGIRALFDVMERMPDADLGSPGPIVHTLERMRGHYENDLVESVKRLPTPLTIWMVNRILNGTRNPEEKEKWLNLLRLASVHPGASGSTRHEAKHFIEHQTDRAKRPMRLGLKQDIPDASLIHSQMGECLHFRRLLIVIVSLLIVWIALPYLIRIPFGTDAANTAAGIAMIIWAGTAIHLAKRTRANLSPQRSNRLNYVVAASYALGLTATALYLWYYGRGA